MDEGTRYFESYVSAILRYVKAEPFAAVVLAPGNSGVVMAGLLALLREVMDEAMPSVIQIATYRPEPGKCEIGDGNLAKISTELAAIEFPVGPRRVLIVDDEIGSCATVARCVNFIRAVLTDGEERASHIALIAEPHRRDESVLSSVSFYPYMEHVDIRKPNVIRTAFVPTGLQEIRNVLEHADPKANRNLCADPNMALNVVLDVPVKLAKEDPPEFFWETRDYVRSALSDFEAQRTLILDDIRRVIRDCMTCRPV